MMLNTVKYEFCCDDPEFISVLFLLRVPFHTEYRICGFVRERQILIEPDGSGLSE